MDYLVIPAYEPDYNLIRLIKKVREKSYFEVIVINDGSSASCNRVFEQAATYATILHHSLNQGKGQALKTAFRYIQSQGHYGVIVTADADGQHKLWDILRVANHMVILAGGKVIGEGTPQELFRQDELLARAALAAPHLLQLGQKLDAAGYPVGGCTTAEDMAAKILAER